MNWTVAQAKRDMEAGFLCGYEMHRVPLLNNVWLIWLASMSGVYQAGHLIDARQKQPRHFKTLEAAVAALTEIGFVVDRLGDLKGLRK